VLIYSAGGVGVAVSLTNCDPRDRADPDSYREVGVVEVLVFFVIVVVKAFFQKRKLSVQVQKTATDAHTLAGAVEEVDGMWVGRFHGVKLKLFCFIFYIVSSGLFC